jgi:hypothetical protein
MQISILVKIPRISRRIKPLRIFQVFLNKLLLIPPQSNHKTGRYGQLTTHPPGLPLLHFFILLVEDFDVEAGGGFGRAAGFGREGG